MKDKGEDVIFKDYPIGAVTYYEQDRFWKNQGKQSGNLIFFIQPKRYF